ncbi:hypothetical protein [Planctomycetes bacterium K23_9]|uniref:FlgN protein n=1 Tax=Stieleria marina TaxID=1930275 RepID=A0A517NXP5_9BACT|nr:hypothetical protein K239x_38780 [Planctomycetes bacterium K23_9]
MCDKAQYTQLHKLTLQLLQQYKLLDQVVDALNEGPAESIDDINEQMLAIKETEKSLLPLREVFRQTNDSLPDELRNPTDETIELVKGLMPKLAQLEKTTLESANRLFPKIQESVRAVQMQNAYGGGRRG